MFCLLLALLLLCVKLHAHSVCRRGVWGSANTGTQCCQNISEQVGVLFKISFSWEANTCYLHLFGIGHASAAFWWNPGLCVLENGCVVFYQSVLQTGFEEDDTSCRAEMDPCEFLYAALKIYVNQDMARTFWRSLLCLGNSWEFISFPPPRLGAVTYSTRPAWHLFPPLPGRFHLCFKSKSCHQPEGSVCWAASSTGLECWYILRYLRYFQNVSGVGRLLFTWVSEQLWKSWNCSYFSCFVLKSLEVKCVRSFLLEICQRRKSLLWHGLRYGFCAQMKLSSFPQPWHS